MRRNLRNKPTKKNKRIKYRKTNKRGGVGSAEKKKLRAERLAASKQKVADILVNFNKSQDQSRTNINNMFREIQKYHHIKLPEHRQKFLTVEELQQMYEPKPAYDLGAAEHTDPAYDLGAAEHTDPAYAIPDYLTVHSKTTSPQYAELGPMRVSPSPPKSGYIEVQPDSEKIKPSKLKPVVPFTIKPGSWNFYILQLLDNEPKSENELSELMTENFPSRMTGKTPSFTLNTQLQLLVKEGYAGRIQLAKGKRPIYKYFIKDPRVPAAASTVASASSTKKASPAKKVSPAAATKKISPAPLVKAVEVREKTKSPEEPIKRRIKVKKTTKKITIEAKPDEIQTVKTKSPDEKIETIKKRTLIKKSAKMIIGADPAEVETQTVKTKRRTPCPRGTRFDIKTSQCVPHNKTKKSLGSPTS